MAKGKGKGAPPPPKDGGPAPPPPGSDPGGLPRPHLAAADLASVRLRPTDTVVTHRDGTQTLEPAGGGAPVPVPQTGAERRRLAALFQPPVTPFRPPRFAPEDAEGLRAYLDEHGYAVVRGVSGDVARAQELFWDYMEALPGEVRRGDPETWGRDFIADPASGIISSFGFGQSAFLWHCRTLPAVRAAFEAIWGTADLLTSFDGGNAFRPTEKWRTRGGWWHCDQHTANHGPGRVCVQGLVALTPPNRWTGGLCVVPGSHRDHAAFCRRAAPRSTHDFVPAPDGDPVLAHGGVLLEAEAGDLLLWDSRTIHCNTPALEPAETAPSGAVPPPHELLRLAGYVCMTPASWASRAVLVARAEAARDGDSTTHWPHRFVRSGRALPDVPPRRPEDFSREQTRLILGDRGSWEPPASRCRRRADPGCSLL